MEHEPSRGHGKDPLRAGWSHPLGRDRIHTFLLERGVRLDRLALAMPSPEDRPLLLIRARRYGDLSLEGKRRLQDEDRQALDPVSLRIFALPRDQLASGREALVPGALDAALRWIVDARDRGNAWQATERLWTAHLVDGAAVVSEDQRQSRGAYLGYTGLEDR
jgi:hypothetical protein